MIYIIRKNESLPLIYFFTKLRTIFFIELFKVEAKMVLFASCSTVILFPLRSKSWIEFNFYCTVKIIYLLLSSRRDVDWLSRQLPSRCKRCRILCAGAIIMNFRCRMTNVRRPVFTARFYIQDRLSVLRSHEPIRGLH